MSGRVGFACAYAPLPLIHAAGLVPYRILPLGEAPDRAGALLHDSLCPHVKRVLDRVLAQDLPELEGMVLMLSCDAMRRLADAWSTARPGDRLAVVDLPVTDDEGAVERLAAELRRLADRLGQWSGAPRTDADLAASCDLYERLAAGLGRVGERFASGALAGGRAKFQELLNRSVSEPPEATLAEIEGLLAQPETRGAERLGVPILLVGNVLPDPGALALVESCGALVVADDLCSGSRQLAAPCAIGHGDAVTRLARASLRRPRCARTISSAEPGSLAREVVERARAVAARGVVVHVAKFCDPYLARIPALRGALRQAGIPTLVLEGDCSLRSLGQQRTRVAAFVEMLEA